MEVKTEEVTHDPMEGTTKVVKTKETVPAREDMNGAQADHVAGWIGYLAGILEILLALRIVFLLFGAHNTGFVAGLYSITKPLVDPFRGIFTAPTVDTGYFDVAALVAMIIYALIAWALVALLDVAFRPRSTVL